MKLRLKEHIVTFVIGSVLGFALLGSIFTVSYFAESLGGGMSSFLISAVLCGIIIIAIYKLIALWNNRKLDVVTDHQPEGRWLWACLLNRRRRKRLARRELF
ncbi:MAG: hypothetical protein K9M03_04140 [Kiritimatiellales bacterium]|nr:hypothetical protein [Kiritimatiellales bacterium]